MGGRSVAQSQPCRIKLIPNLALHGTTWCTTGKDTDILTCSHSLCARGTVGFHERWAAEVGDASYEWEKTLPFFKKSVTFASPPTKDSENRIRWDETAFESGDGGYGRPLQLCYASSPGLFNSQMLTAMKSLGFAETDGLNSGKLSGVSMGPVTFDPQDATRSSSETAFLQPALHRPNLRIYTHTSAQKIKFDGADATRAVGVTVNTAGTEYVLKAKNEVIVSAGVVSSTLFTFELA